MAASMIRESGMRGEWTELLRCPQCGGALAPDWVATPLGGRGAWGTLRCACATYPVIDDIPVMAPQRSARHSIGVPAVLEEGPTTAELVRMVRGSDPLAALVALVAVPPTPWPLGRLPLLRQAATSPSLSGVVRRLGGGALRGRLARRDETAAEDWLAYLYLDAPRRGDEYAYFLYRLTQPRQLAYHAVLQAVPPGLVLDVGCGLGHLSWTLSLRGHDVVGVDYNFSQLWVARWWVAPRSRFVCADVTHGLPVAAGQAACAMFADGLHLVPDPAALLAAMRRSAGDGTVFLLRFGNAAVAPSEGHERTLEGWRTLFAAAGRQWLGDQDTLVEGYLEGRAADLTTSHDDAALRRGKWLAAVLSDDPARFADQGPLPEPPPHAHGRLSVNPLYLPVGREPGRYRLQLPSDWFTFEDGALTRYHDHQAVITREQARDLARGEVTPRLRPLIDRFVVIGVPERYLGSRPRPLKLRAYQAATALFPRLVQIPDAAALPPREPAAPTQEQQGPPGR